MQHTGIHPDDNPPTPHPPRQLTHDKISTITEHAEDWITTNEILLGQMLHQLPQIPPHAANRRLWAAGPAHRNEPVSGDPIALSKSLSLDEART